MDNSDASTLLIKNIPKSISDITNLLPYAPKELKQFGRRRVLVTYENEAVAQTVLQQLQQLELIPGKHLNAAFFRKNEKPAANVKPSKKVTSSKTTQTSLHTAGDAAAPQISKQLGLLETIYVEGESGTDKNNSSYLTKLRKPQLSMQPYKYLICMDFEATCWENQAPPKWREAEIIEFPAVMVNLQTGKIEAEFHKYVMPIESPKLSAFCTELTGIKQQSVDNGMPLQTAIMMFQEWLRKELRARNLQLPKMSKDKLIGNCAFVTWTDWDFGICLAKECQRKRLKKPTYFNQWIDLRAIFREWYKYKPINFADALSHVGLAFEGREHSGIDDARNLAALAYKLTCDGAPLAITKDLAPFQLNSNCIL
ncbi:ERI1 exoribonuclease 2-like isoform X2 [Rhagoletis pomonella]|uniref:ERI1 exoribonuclease 2-like isoform X2 n=2 Tax=Rhagoletis pomonella TaxID=28610 RepID=UPI0017871632|nr:ERI1 exoribonuclease 2-like isoform X2 [Rhagoletis pomonella]